MKSYLKVSARGIARLGLILIAVVAIGLVGFAGWKAMSGKKDGSNPVSRAALEAACTEKDKNICKFQASWKEQKYYTVITRSTGEDVVSESTYKSEGENRFHVITTGQFASEIITIGKTTYTKAPNGTWWKQTAKPEETKQYSESFDYSGPEEASNSENPTDTTTYKSLGTEACGNLTCFKYQVLNSSTPEDKEYSWFDTDDYQLRRTRTELKDGTVNDSTFSYDKVTIQVPSPVRELGPNEYLMPDSNETTTIPDAGSAQDYMNSLPSSQE